jgi:hypothetical protein
MKIRPLFMMVLQSLLVALCPLLNHAQNCSQEEVDFMNENQEKGQNIAAGCYIECILSDNPDSCVVACMSEAYPQISDTCMQCAPPQMQCVSEACWLPCLFPNSAACEECVIENCGPAFLQCIGDDDGDGYTVDGGDCNNQDADINPDAEDMEGDGIDQNCDGVDGLALGIADRDVKEVQIQFENARLCVLSEHLGEIRIYSATGLLIDEMTISTQNKCIPLDYKGLMIYTFESESQYSGGVFFTIY